MRIKRIRYTAVALAITINTNKLVPETRAQQWNNVHDERKREKRTHLHAYWYLVVRSIYFLEQRFLHGLAGVLN